MPICLFHQPLINFELGTFNYEMRRSVLFKKIKSKPAFFTTLLSMGFILILLGCIGVFSITEFFLALARIRKDYIPMAPDTGFLFITFGIILILEGYKLINEKIRRVLAILFGLVTVYAALKVAEYFLKTDLTFGNLLFPTHAKLNQFPMYRMSPVTGALFSISGLSFFFSYIKGPRERKLKMSNIAGFIIGNAGVIAFLGYLFGSPFLYAGKMIPMAATTSICFLALGLGLMTLAEEKSILNKLFNRENTRGRMMRVVLPLVVSAILIQGLVQVRLVDNEKVDHAILSAMLTMLFSVITPIIIFRLTKVIYSHNERTEKEKNEAQELLLAERERLRVLIDNLPDRIFFKDRLGKFVVANKGVAEHSGVESQKEIIGKTDFDLYGPELAREYFRDEQTLMQSGEPLLNHEEPSRDASGIIGWTLTSKIPIRNRAGEVVGLVGVSREISEFKKMFEDLSQAKDSLEQALKLKDYFIANLSHEIRTPLNAIIGFSELLNEEVSEVLPDISEKYFSIINSASQRLTRTIDMILNLSRLQSGMYKVISVPIDLDRVIKDLLTEFQLSADQKNLNLSFENTIGTAIIQSDMYCVTQSISNLIDNALKYTYHGYISIRIYQVDAHWIKVDVQDTGIGIKEEYKSRLFESFSQEDPSFTRTFEGIGLGLAITKKMLETIGARIYVASTKQVGTTFTIEFPLFIQH